MINQFNLILISTKIITYFILHLNTKQIINILTHLSNITTHLSNITTHLLNITTHLLNIITHLLNIIDITPILKMKFILQESIIPYQNPIIFINLQISFIKNIKKYPKTKSILIMHIIMHNNIKKYKINKTFKTKFIKTLTTLS